MKNRFIKKLEDFEIQHKILFFLVIIALTILLTRLTVNIYNPPYFIYNFELHHFDYGLVLLIIAVLLLLFGEKRYLLYLFLSAISIGLIIDDYWFIRSNINDLGITETLIYNNTFPSAIAGIIILILIIFLIKHFLKKKAGK